MIVESQIALKVSEPALKKLKESLGQIRSYEPIVVLTLTRHPGERRYHWTIGFHDLSVVSGNNYTGMLVNCSDCRIVIPIEQEKFTPSLTGAVLDLKDSTFVVVAEDSRDVITWESKDRD
jgi:hypothetical protein